MILLQMQLHVESLTTNIKRQHKNPFFIYRTNPQKLLFCQKRDFFKLFSYCWGGFCKFFNG